LGESCGESATAMALDRALTHSLAQTVSKYRQRACATMHAHDGVRRRQRRLAAKAGERS